MMDMSRVRWKVVYLAAMAALVLAPACSGDDGEVPESFECGPGTVLEGGQCVVADHDCPDGEVATPLGRCEEPEVFCGQGTVYDTEEQDCVLPSEVVCGEGTEPDEGICRVKEPLHCGAGTLLANSECVLAESVCGPGTELRAPHCEIDEDAACDGRSEWDVQNGECVDLGAVECGGDTVEVDDACVPMATFADTLASEADIDYQDNLPIEVSEEEPFVFSGTLDGELSHTFELTADEGQWLQIELYPRGLPSPGLKMEEVIGSWAHRVSPGLSNQPSITAFIPEQDTYQLTVSTFVNPSDHPQASGDASWQYVGTVEIVEAPDPLEWEDLDETMAGDFAGSPPLVKVDVDGVDEILLTTTEIGADVRGARLEVWNDVDEYAEAIDLEPGEREQIDVSAQDEVHLYFTAVELVGPRTEFSVEAATTETLSPGEHYHHELSAEAGEVIFISHRSMQAESVAVTVWRDQQPKYQLDEVLAENRSSYSVTETMREFFYVPYDGDYVVEFENTTSSDIQGFVSTTTAEEIPTFEVPDDGPAQFDTQLEAQDLEPGEWRFALIKTPSAGFFDITITAGSGNPRASVFDGDRNELIDSFGSLGVNQMSLEAPQAGPYFVVSRPWSTFTLVSGGLHFEIEGQAVDTLEPGGIYEEVFDAQSFDVLVGNISNLSGGDIELRLKNPQGQMVFEKSSSEEVVDVAELFPGPGEFTLEVENVGDEPLLGFDVSLDVVTPRELMSADSGFSDNYSLDSLSAGDREVVVLQTHIDLQLDARFLFDAGEEAALRLWNIDESSLVDESVDEQRVDIVETLAQGIYVLELEALTDIDDGTYFGLTGTEVVFVEGERIHEPPRDILAGDIEDSALSVSGCSEILDASVVMDMPSGLATQIHIDLDAPNVSDLIALRTGNSGSLTTTYPEETEPADSFDALEGTSANGVWLLYIDNQSCCTNATLASWSVHLTCAKQ